MSPKRVGKNEMLTFFNSFTSSVFWLKSKSKRRNSSCIVSFLFITEPWTFNKVLCKRSNDSNCFLSSTERALRASNFILTRLSSDASSEKDSMDRVNNKQKKRTSFSEVRSADGMSSRCWEATSSRLARPIEKVDVWQFFIVLALCLQSGAQLNDLNANLTN